MSRNRDSKYIPIVGAQLSPITSLSSICQQQMYKSELDGSKWKEGRDAIDCWCKDESKVMQGRTRREESVVLPTMLLL
jgi:hypothetical protein